jgi:uncharacterized membrane protein (Fun14 family)
MVKLTETLKCMILVKFTLKVTVKVIAMVTGIHALSVLQMVPRYSHVDSPVSFNYLQD